MIYEHLKTEGEPGVWYHSIFCVTNGERTEVCTADSEDFAELIVTALNHMTPAKALRSIAIPIERTLGTSYNAQWNEAAQTELDILRKIVARGHDSHDCPNGNCPDGHCAACMDRYWQTEGPNLQNKVFELEQELATLRIWLVTFHEFMKTAPPAQREFGPSHISKAYMDEYLKGMPSPPP